jgi:hypothetical protein
MADWAPLILETSEPLRDVPRDVAERVFAALMAARTARGQALEALAASHGVTLAGDDATRSLGTWLGDWLRRLGPEALGGAESRRFSGLAVDAALWLGQRIIARSGDVLRWELYTGVKKSTGYQRAVLTGFRKVDDPRYYVDVAHFVSSWCELCARRRAARSDFLATIEETTLADA